MCTTASMSFNELFSIHYESDSSNESLIKIISRELNIFLEITVFLKSQFWCRAEYRKGFSSDLIIFSLPRTVPVSKIVKNGPLNLFYSYDTLWLGRNILERPKLFKNILHILILMSDGLKLNIRDARSPHIRIEERG